MSEHKCEKKIWDRFHYHLCGKTARYEHEGKWYCKTHHPPTRKAYEDARNEKWQAKWDAQEQASREADKARAEMQRKAAAYDGLVAQRDALLEALKDAATSLATVGRLAGKSDYLGDDGERIPTYMGCHDEVREYATSRAGVARAIERKVRGEE